MSLILPTRFTTLGSSGGLPIYPNISTYTFTAQIAHSRTNEECISLSSGTTGIPGRRIWLGAGIHRQVRQYNMSASWDITTIPTPPAFTRDYNPATADMVNVYGVWFDEVAERMWLSGTGGSNGNPRIVAYELPTAAVIDGDGDSAPSAFEPTRIGHINTNSLGITLNNPRDLCVKPDGTRIIVSEGTTQYQLDIGTAWDPTTIAYNGVSSLTNVQQSNQYVTRDGQYMYLFRFLGSPGFVMQYPFSSVWDLATLGAVKSTLNVTAKTTVGRGLYVNPDHMYILGDTDFFQYDS